MAGEALVVLFLVFGIVGPLVLYALVRSEHDQRTKMDRATAERAARRDTDDEEE